MDTVPLALQVGVCVVISLAAVAVAVIVWRDDHKWRERRTNGAPVVEPGPYPLGRPGRVLSRHRRP